MKPDVENPQTEHKVCQAIVHYRLPGKHRFHVIYHVKREEKGPVCGLVCSGTGLLLDVSSFIRRLRCILSITHEYLSCYVSCSHQSQTQAWDR